MSVSNRIEATEVKDKISPTRWWIETKFCGMMKFRAGWTKFHVIKTKFRFFESKFRFGETKYCFMERKFCTRLGRELFNWADMSFSIRVRIVYESWSLFLGRFPFVRTDRPIHSRRNDNFTFSQNWLQPDQSNPKWHLRRRTFSAKTLWKSLFHFQSD